MSNLKERLSRIADRKEERHQEKGLQERFQEEGLKEFMEDDTLALTADCTWQLKARSLTPLQVLSTGNAVCILAAAGDPGEDIIPPTAYVCHPTAHGLSGVHRTQ